MGSPTDILPPISDKFQLIYGGSVSEASGIPNGEESKYAEHRANGRSSIESTYSFPFHPRYPDLPNDLRYPSFLPYPTPI